MVDGPVQALLTAAAAVLDDAALRVLADRLRAADAQPPPIRYRRLVDALGRLPAAASDGAPVAVFLSGDAVVAARMSAAVEVMRAAGFDVDPTGGIVEHLRRAVHWRRHGRGPVSALHRSCATDIARGSLRLWARAGGTPQPLPELPVRLEEVANRQPRAVLVRGQAQLARVQLSAQARAMCAALRADLVREAAELPRRGLGAFEGRVRREVLRVSGELDQALGRRMAGLAEAAGMPEAAQAAPPGVALQLCLPPRRRPRLENRLTALLGTGFGFSIALTSGRVVADLRPDWNAAAAIGCGALGLVLTFWFVGARRLLTERAATERGVTETVANLRAVLEERVLTRVLSLESVLAAGSGGPISNRHRRAVGHTPN